MALAALMLLGARPSSAQNSGSIAGTVVDPLGAPVSGAAVTLLLGEKPAKQVSSNASGDFAFDALSAGRYRIEVTSQGFQTRTTDLLYVAGTGRVQIDVSLAIGPLQQDVVVTAEATAVPVSQIGAQVTVLDAAILDTLGKPDVLEGLRLVPGSQVVQAGGRGAVTSFFVRGGASNFNKVLIDGVAANDVGGGFDFSSVAVTGVDSVEVLRESNSVKYGLDALTGVVSIATKRGRTATPEFTYAIDGGNLGTLKNDLSIGGASGRYDYFADYSYFTTNNDVPNNEYHIGTFAGRFSAALGHGTDLSGTIRRADTTYGAPNAILFYGIPDDSVNKGDFTYASVTAQSQISDRWQSQIRFGSMVQNSHDTNPAPTGTPFDPFGFGANYLGNNMTITGANGYSVTGQAILDFSGGYPKLFDGHTTRNALSGQLSYRAGSILTVSGGGRFENEQGFTQSGGTSTPKDESSRNNGGLFGEARITAGRLFASGGVGYEHNAVFKNAVTPRVSVAYYARNTTTASPNDTKLTFNYGKGIKAPTIFQELNSVFGLVPPTLATTLGVEPVGPERAQTLDVGVEQGLMHGQMRVRVTYFHNTFDDLLEFLSQQQLILIGIPPAAANATAFGAYANSQSTTGDGVELSVDALVAKAWRLAFSYTYLDAEVTKALSATASTNDAFPGIPIGAFSPLVGNRPFRRPANTGNMLVSYTKGPGQIAVAGYFSGKADDSTFLSDAFFGNSLLLPNQDLDKGYAKIDVSGSYRLHPRLKWYATIENLFNQDYQAASGFPALPFNIRTGVTITVGGR
jgi:iron complex outermembrane receptor protein/vitamin B12 transporter